MSTPRNEDEDTKVIQVEKNPFDLPEIPPEGQFAPYWIGTLPSCPQWNVQVGGVTFHRYTDPPVETDTDSGQTQRAFTRGQVVHLSAAKVQSIKEALKNKVVRFVGPNRGFLLNRDGNKYLQSRFDEPLAMHVYLIAHDEKAFMKREDVRGGYPKSLYEMAGGKPRVREEAKSNKPLPEVAAGIDDIESPNKYHTELKGQK